MSERLTVKVWLFALSSALKLTIYLFVKFLVLLCACFNEQFDIWWAAIVFALYLIKSAVSKDKLLTSLLGCLGVLHISFLKYLYERQLWAL